jgi:outer membrane protein assembly factor BamB
LTGELMQLYGEGSVLLARVPRNNGGEWIRVNTQTGKLIWSLPARSQDSEPAGLCIGDTAFYQVQNETLLARSLNDGRLLWSRPLDVHADRWTLRYTSDALAVIPASAPKDADFTIAFLDPFDGRWLQRISFAGKRGVGVVVWTPDRAIVSIGGEVYGFRSLNTE